MKQVVWTGAIELLVKQLGEKALSMSWLHQRCDKRFSYYNNFLAIPAIVLSTITGAGSIGFGTSGEVSLAMGAVSILVSIITTLNSYFLFAKQSKHNPRLFFSRL